jgi:hypothetical protein
VVRVPVVPLVVAALVVPLLALGAARATASPGTADPVVLPPVGADWDYQLGGARKPAERVGIVSRDRSAAPSPGRYNICYVNAFQTQASEKRFWRSRPGRWALVLKKDGRPVTDSGWGEWLLDTRTAGRRDRLARIVGRWIAGCATDGFDAVELDNLDSWSRSSGLVSRADNRRFARLLVARAHRHGLAAAQKNWVELGAAGPRIGFDFAVVEQCGQFHECGAYARTYGDRVLAVEYSRRSFRWTCDHVGDHIPVVRRDLDLTRGGVRRWC